MTAGAAGRGAARHRIGLISDTHGLLRPEAVRVLRGCERIVHAGDIGGAGVLSGLAALAPVTAVRGNNDTDAFGGRLPEIETLQIGDLALLVIHERGRLDLGLHARGVRVVVSGHSHRPGVEERDGILYVNPGSAGPRRFKLPIAVAELIIEGTRAEARIVRLDDFAKSA
jgi:putative phosphoesterase